MVDDLNELEALGGARGSPDATAGQPTSLTSPEEAQTQRYTRQRKQSILNAAPDVTTDDEYAAIESGTRYRGPDKQIRQKPYAVTSPEDYDQVPEGAHYTDPQGQTRQKPVPEGVGYSAETLYQMARTPDTREQALKKFYGDKVKRDTRGEFYVEDENGKILRPGHGLSGVAGTWTAEAAPAAGMIGGTILGAAGGEAAEPIGGFIPGGAGGAMLGAAAGRQLNNVVLALAGIHESLPSQLESMAGEAAGVGAGELVGRGVTKIPAALATTRRTATGVRDSAGSLRENLPKVLEQLGVTPAKARKFLGTTQQAAERASDITKEEVHIPGTPEGETTNVRVPPSVYAPEAPYLKKIEEFDRVFRSQDVVQQSWEAFYNKQTEEILADHALGVNLGELATRATKKVSSEHAGMMALSAAQKDMAAADAALENARRDATMLARRSVDQAGGEEAVQQFRQAAMDRLKAAYERAQGAAEHTIQTAAKTLRGQIDLSIRAAAEGEDTGDLNRVIAASFQAHSVGLRARARLMYDAAGDAAGGARIDAGNLSQEANAFLQSVPEQVRQKYPVEIANLAKIAKAMEKQEGGQFHTEAFDVMGEAGGTEKEPTDTTLSFGELHQLRSWFRYGIDYQDMTPDMRSGSLKLFEKKIDSLLHSGMREAGLGPLELPSELSVRVRAEPSRRGGETMIGELVDKDGTVHYTAQLSATGPAEDRYIQWVENVSRQYSKLGPAFYNQLARAVEQKGGKLYGRFDGPESFSPSAEKVHDQLAPLGGLEKTGGLGPRIIRHVPQRPSSPKSNLATAAELLDQADGFYKQNIPFLSDQMVQGTIDMLKSGEGANPEALAKMFFNPERTAAMARVRGIVGENLWKGVQAADVRHMLDEARILGSDDIDGAKFAQQVEQRIRNGILERAYDGRTAARLQKIATDIRTLKGELPVSTDPGDTISTLMNRAKLAKEEADKFAETDPLAALKQETSRIDKEYNQAAKTAKISRQQEPLHFLYENSMSHLAVRAADKILGAQDLIQAAATKFGRDSSEFNALRQVYAARFLQRPFSKTASLRAELGSEKGMTEETQALMFPGVTRDQMVTLAKNMEFLFSAGGTDIGGSLAAASRVLHPEANFPIQLKGLKVLMGVPGVSTAARWTLGQYFALMMDATTRPNFIHWLAGRLEGDVFARAEARAAIQQRIRMGALLGRGFGQQNPQAAANIATLGIPAAIGLGQGQQDNQQPETMQ